LAFIFSSVIAAQRCDAQDTQDTQDTIMARFKLTIEYEGTRYSGWQVQKNARTVQGEIIGALRDVLKSNDFELYGSGRTDAGVHALWRIWRHRPRSRRILFVRK
jgi:hypothetical protein